MEAEDFDALYRAHAPAVLAYCLRRADRETAEDAVSQTFVVAWRRRAEVPLPGLPWLLGVARRTLANERRAARRQDAVAGRLAAQPVGPEDPARGAPVLEALRSLSERDQEVLRLAAWDDLPSDQAARVLGCSPTAYRLRLHRARRRLSRALATLEPAMESTGRARETTLEMEETRT